MHLCLHFITASGSEEVGVTYFLLFVNSCGSWAVKLKVKMYDYTDGQNLESEQLMQLLKAFLQSFI